MVSFNNLKMSFKDMKMFLKGYQKVPLKDTKGVLTKANNFKWEKDVKYDKFPYYKDFMIRTLPTKHEFAIPGVHVTVLPTGTKIVEDLDGFTKIVEKGNGKKIIREGSLMYRDYLKHYGVPKHFSESERKSLFASYYTVDKNNKNITYLNSQKS